LWGDFEQAYLHALYERCEECLALPLLWDNISNVDSRTDVAKPGSLSDLRCYFGTGWDILVYLIGHELTAYDGRF
jgi:hypothetical protein